MHTCRHTHTHTHTQPCTHAPQAVVTLLSFLINNAPYGSTPGDTQTSQGEPFPGLTLLQSRGKPWLPIAQNSLGCMITPREKDLSPRFGNAGRDHRDHLAQSIKASYRHHLFRNLGWAGEESWVGFISSHLWKKQMLQANANANITAQGGEGGGCEFPEQTAPSQTSGWSSSTETIWKSKWSTDHPDHTPLEISNLFLLESEHSSRNKVGSSL